jgi:AraC-like DNA-binding protein
VRSALATEYLRQAHHSVTDVAFLLGYSDPRNFARAFRRWMGQSPQEFRATHAKTDKETVT